VRTTDERILAHLHNIQNNVLAINALLAMRPTPASPRVTSPLEPDKATRVKEWLEANPYTDRVLAHQVRADIMSQVGVTASYQLIRAVMSHLGYRCIREAAGVTYHPAS
jgi:hypothetical protein